jgi:hypothetical protein
MGWAGHGLWPDHWLCCPWAGLDRTGWPLDRMAMGWSGHVLGLVGWDGHRFVRTLAGLTMGWGGHGLLGIAWAGHGIG